MLFHPVAVERPNPQYAALFQEQLGDTNGELKAAMQKFSSLPEVMRKETVHGRRTISSKARMKQYMENIKSV